MQTLKKSEQQTQWVWPNTKINHVLPLHDNARPQTSMSTKEAIATMGWTVLPHHSVQQLGVVTLYQTSYLRQCLDASFSGRLITSNISLILICILLIFHMPYTR